MARTLRVGMIGYGFMGRAHSNAWRQAGHFFPLKARVELHTICGRNRTAVETARAQLGWQFSATDWREVVESPLIDIVDINAPNGAHAEIAIAAARNGKHVLCEKPLATSVKEAEAMFAAVQKARVMHMVCHNYRRIPAVAQARKMIQEGAVGNILHFHGRYAQDWALDAEHVARRQLRKGPDDCGANVDINVHIIDLARYLVGELKEISGFTHCFPKDTAPALTKGVKLPGKAGPKPGGPIYEDSTWLQGRFESGAVANLAATRCALGRKNHITFEVNGTRGSLYFNFEEMNWLRYFDGTTANDRLGFRDILVTQANGTHPYVGHWWPPGHGLGYEHTFVHTVADFVNACIDGKAVAPTFEDGLKNQRVLEAVVKSGKTGKWVSL